MRGDQRATQFASDEPKRPMPGDPSSAGSIHFHAVGACACCAAVVETIAPERQRRES